MDYLGTAHWQALQGTNHLTLEGDPAPAVQVSSAGFLMLGPVPVTGDSAKSAFYSRCKYYNVLLLSMAGSGACSSP